MHRSIWGVGDCAVSGSPPTAQVANQEGRYLGGLLNGLAAADPAALKTPAAAGLAATVGELDTFDYAHKGSFAYIGNNEALAQMPVGGDGLGADVRMNGSAVFVAWRAVYFSKLLSYRNRMMVMLDWVKTKTFGRDTSRS